MKREVLQEILDLLVDAEARTFDELDHAIDEDDRFNLRFLDQKIKGAAEYANWMLAELGKKERFKNQKGDEAM